MEVSLSVPNTVPQMDSVMANDQMDDMDLGDLDLDGIEKACADKEKGYVLVEQVKLLHAAILKSRDLGIGGIARTDNKRKFKEVEEKRGRKTNRQRIAEVGVKLVESGQ